MQGRRHFPRGRARFQAFFGSIFGGSPRQLKRAAAISLAAFFLPAAPATAILPDDVAAANAPAGPGPALWVVQDADTTIFLFGTFHALDSHPGWFNRSVRAAFNAADQLVLETLVPEDPAELQSVIARQVATSEPRAGQPVFLTGRPQSFVASAGQAMSAGRAIGMSIEHGADAVLRRAANAHGKPVAGLESFEFQLRMFAALPPPGRGQARRAGSMGGVIGDMQSAWKRGDNAGFAAVLGDVRMHSPLAYKMLFADRNASWAGWIARRLAQPGTVFVAVGTGHLVGPDSVQHQLAQRGISSIRVS